MSECVCVCVSHAYGNLQKSREDIGVPGTGVVLELNSASALTIGLIPSLDRICSPDSLELWTPLPPCVPGVVVTDWC